MDEFVSFGDYVEEWAVPIMVTLPGTRDEIADNGKLVKGVDSAPEQRMAVVLPLSNRDLEKVDNGRYTSNDRKVYATEALGIGVKVEHDGIVYEIDRELPQREYTDVYRYFAKGKGPGYT